MFFPSSRERIPQGFFDGACTEHDHDNTVCLRTSFPIFSLYSSYLFSVTVTTYPSLADHQLQLRISMLPWRVSRDPWLFWQATSVVSG